MSVSDVSYVSKSIAYAQSQIEGHEGPLNQELNDLVFGVSLLYDDLKELRPKLDTTIPSIKKDVTVLKERSSSPKITRIAKRSLTPSHQKMHSGRPITKPVSRHSARLPASHCRKRAKVETDPVRRSDRLAITRGIGPTGLKGIPNYASNCFAISAYQLVKSNPSLYNAIFKSPTFKADRRFDALRAFDRKYDSGIPLSAADMQKVRTDCLTQFGIPDTEHQDPYEVLTNALFAHIPASSPLYSTITTTRVLEFTVPKDMVDTSIMGMDNTKVISQEEMTGNQVKVRVRQTLRTDPMLSLPVSLTGISSGATLEEVIAQDLSEVSEELQELSPEINAREINRDFTLNVPKTLMLTLKRFDSYGNKVSDPVSVPSGEIRLDERGAHQVKGFVVHLGQDRDNGHYVEFQKVGSQWFLNDDKESNPISTAAAICAMQDAYILYAERP
jgi:hypothetical protein